MSVAGFYRVCKDRSGEELVALGYTFGSSRLDERMALQQTIVSDIKYAFLSGRRFGISRYGDGSWPVYYTAAEVQTAIHETAFHSRGEWMRAKRPSARRQTRKILYHVKINSTKGDTPPVVVDMLNPTDYSYCHAVAKRARASGFDFIDVPSVRYSGGMCRPVFTMSCIEPAPGIEARFTIFWDQTTDELSHNADRTNREINLWYK